MCSRVLGLAREQIFAALFGGGRLMDAFTIAFRIPNLLRDLFAEGALSTAFITIFSKTISREGDEAAFRLANKVTTLAMITLSALTILGIVFAPWVIWALAPGFDPGKQALTVTLARIMYPFIIMVSLAALVMGMLNARNVFGIPAMASSSSTSAPSSRVLRSAGCSIRISGLGRCWAWRSGHWWGGCCSLACSCRATPPGVQVSAPTSHGGPGG